MTRDMTHDPLCYFYSPDGRFDSVCNNCRLIAKVRADERSRKGTCWREFEGSQIPFGAIRVYREAGWFWEMP